MTDKPWELTKEDIASFWGELGPVAAGPAARAAQRKLLQYLESEGLLYHYDALPDGCKTCALKAKLGLK